MASLQNQPKWPKCTDDGEVTSSKSFPTPIYVSGLQQMIFNQNQISQDVVPDPFLVHAWDVNAMKPTLARDQ